MLERGGNGHLMVAIPAIDGQHEHKKRPGEMMRPLSLWRNLKTPASSHQPANDAFAF